MTSLATAWTKWRPLLLELFLISNFGFLVVDIFTAHSVNRFHHWAEWIPVGFSGVAAILLLIGLLRRGESGRSRTYRITGYLVGYASIAVGVAGLLFHLESQFFERQSIESLVYTAPFVAPLAYAGLGLLTLLCRMEAGDGVGFGRWVVFLALGGFVGNFVLSLCDHAQNGFFNDAEWIPVVASAYAIGFLTVALFDVDGRFLKLTFKVLALQMIVGLWGFALHLDADVNGISSSVYENFVHGAPVFAPLLFVNLAMLATLGVYDLWVRQRPAVRAT